MKGPISIKHYKTIKCYYSIPFSEVRRTLARKNASPGVQITECQNVNPSSFTRDAYDYVRKKKSKIKFK